MAENSEHNFNEMSLGDHLEELRLRVILALLGFAVVLTICLFFSKFFLSFMAQPYFAAVGQNTDARLQAITLPEKFTVYLKTAMLFSIIFSSPWVFYQLWKFISAGLYPNEKKYVYIIVPACSGLFAVGALFYLFIVAPMVISFFIDFDTGIKFLTTQVTLQSYISFMISMTLIFGLCFQLPIAIIAANRIGIVSTENLKKARKYVLLVIFIIAAIMTPPDVISQIALAVPMYVLFELGVLFCRRDDRS
ncbi:MAG: twin-arginine translocase subunit TatC [Phycisphaerae bacterium]|nr:twin-arginine translocase subunit TatC [Phycisphaerae bacterium]